MLFDELPQSVRRQMTVRELAEGEPLFQQGDRASAIFEVVGGRVRLVRRTIDDHLVALYTARPGDLLAEAALFSDRYHCDAVAAIGSRCLEADARHRLGLDGSETEHLDRYVLLDLRDSNAEGAAPRVGGQADAATSGRSPRSPWRTSRGRSSLSAASSCSCPRRMQQWWSMR